ncbi:MAG: NTP transferase domain-containing protein [Pirellulales bacterium]
MPTFAILPAAGRSQRMGQPKLLLPWRERTIVEHVVSTWVGSRVDGVVVVVHPNDEQIAKLAAAGGAIVVRPQSAPPQMKDSVCLALAEVRARFHPTDADAWLLAPADMPGLTREPIDRLIDAFCESCTTGSAARDTIWAVASSGRRGHPVLFPWTLAVEVEQLGPDEGINSIVERHSVRTVEVGAAAIWQDLDTPEDYERLRPR